MKQHKQPNYFGLYKFDLFGLQVVCNGLQTGLQLVCNRSATIADQSAWSANMR